MQLVVTNISSEPVYIREFYKEIPVGGSVTTERAGSDLSGMAGLIDAINDGKVSVSMTPSAAEIASGFLTPPQSVQAQDMSPVALTDVASGVALLRAIINAPNKYALTVAGGATPAGDVLYTAVGSGDQSSVTVAHTAGAGALSVGVAGTDIVVTLAAGGNTAQEVADAVNAHAQASLLVVASVVAAGDAAAAVAAPLASIGAADVQIYAINSLPFKFRVVDAWALISGAVGSSTVNVYTRAAGAGTKVAGPISSGSAAIARMTGPTTSALATPGALEGLFARLSDGAVAGEVYLLVRRES